MARYKLYDQVIYAGNQEIYTIVDYQHISHGTYYILEDVKGNHHRCHQPHALRIYRRNMVKA